MDIIDRLKALRKENNLTQEELGEMVGMKQEYISNIENKNISPNLYTLQRIAKALKKRIVCSIISLK